MIARNGGSYESVLRERVLDPLGLHCTSLRPAEPYATPYFVEPYSDRLRIEPDPEVSELTGAAGWLWSTTGDLARWADFLCTGADGVLGKSVLDEMSRVHAMVDEERWTTGWGLGLELFRRGDRVLAGHTGSMPGFLAAFCVHRAARTGAAVLTNSGAGAEVEALALDLACAALDALPRSAELWRPGGRGPGRDRASARDDGGRKATRSSSRGWPGGCRRSSSEGRPAGASRCSRPTAWIAGGWPRAGSRASSYASSATTPATW